MSFAKRTIQPHDFVSDSPSLLARCEVCRIPQDRHPTVGQQERDLRPSRLGPGKKTMEWEDVRRALKKVFIERGVTGCEFQLFTDCEGPYFWSFSHGKNRPQLEGDELWSLVVVACKRVCHARIEILPKAEKLALHEEFIQRRGWRVREGGRVEIFR